VKYLSNKVIQGDCLEVLANMSNNSIDFIISDPPYNVGKDFGNLSDKQTEDKYKKFILNWLGECYRVLKMHKKLMFTYSQVGMFWVREIIKQTEFNFVQVLVYQSPNISSFKGSPLYVRNYEPIFVLSKNKPERLNRIKGVSTVDVLRYTHPQSNFKRDKLYHPTQKPKALWKRLILENTREGDVVLDTFAGICLAHMICKEINRKSICIELNKNYIKMSKIKEKEEKQFCVT